MSSDGGPKLYTNKPKKPQLKQQRKSDLSSSASNPMASSSSSSTTTTTTTTTTPTSSSSSSGLPPPKESLARRFKFVWPILLTLNLGIGAYVYLSASKKDQDAKDAEETATEVPSTPAAVSTPVAVPEKPAQAAVVALKPREPIPENQQRELFKWILEEKRKVKPKDPEEKKRVDEEKAVLKQFIKAKSVPSF
ncbi:hypothetical protein Scep_007735 [Stephania cephalantha]|uniref:Uncharacterized protein n=1 Tax=Stephania cephalantha TaxID=152367 RepID=A0AAP0KAE6_9MAGN